MKAMTILLSVVPGVGCHLGLIDDLFGVIEEMKNPCGCRGFKCVSFEAEGKRESTCLPLVPLSMGMHILFLQQHFLVLPHSV